MRYFDFEPIKQEVISCDDYLNITQNDMDRIKSIEFEPPKVGKSFEFGAFRVIYKNPVYDFVR